MADLHRAQGRERPFRASPQELRLAHPGLSIRIWRRINEPRPAGKAPHEHTAGDLQEIIERAYARGGSAQFCEPLRPHARGKLPLDWETYHDEQPTGEAVKAMLQRCLATIQQVFGADDGFVMEEAVYVTSRHRWTQHSGRRRYKVGLPPAALRKRGRRGGG